MSFFVKNDFTKKNLRRDGSEEHEELGIPTWKKKFCIAWVASDMLSSKKLLHIPQIKIFILFYIWLT